MIGESQNDLHSQKATTFTLVASLAIFIALLSLNISLAQTQQDNNLRDTRAGQQTKGSGTSSKAPKQDQAEQISDALKGVNRLQRFTLRHRLNKADQVRWDVEHIASVETKVGQHEEKISSRTRSVKLWKVIEVDATGNMTFQNSVERLSMWNKSGEQEPISFDSEDNQEVPPMFRTASKSVGVTLATVTIDPQGQVIDRNSDLPSSSFGAGEVTIPFPEQPIGIGHKWSVPAEFTAKHSDGRVKNIKSRRLYTLVSVDNQIATIEFKTEILTPIEDPTIKSQIIQKLNRGKLQFDLVKGRMISRETDWNERVQGFEGADSNMEYMGRLTETLRLPRTSKKKSVENEASDVVIKPSDGKPIIRKR